MASLEVSGRSEGILSPVKNFSVSDEKCMTKNSLMPVCWIPGPLRPLEEQAERKLSSQGIKIQNYRVHFVRKL